MEVPINPDLLEKLRRVAAEQGRASEALIVEAIERLVNYDEWFLREIDQGLAAADRTEARHARACHHRFALNSCL
jgi:predicted transcriptional regulator